MLADTPLHVLDQLVERNHWVHPVNKERSRYGEFHHLFEALEKDEARFHSYFRMKKDTFYTVLELIQHDIKKQDIGAREVISPKERLAITLR